MRRSRAQPGGDGIELRGGGPGRIRLVRHAIAQDLTDSPKVIAAHGGDGQDLDVVKAVGNEQVVHVLQQGRSSPGGEGIDLIDQNQHVLLTGAQTAQVAFVERRIGILLGIDDPHKNVGQRHEAVDLQGVRSRHRVVVGHVEQDQPGELVLIRSVQEGLAAYATFTADAQEVQKGTRIVAPGAGCGLRRGGAAGTDIGELQLGQGVEQRGLTGAGTAE